MLRMKDGKSGEPLNSTRMNENVSDEHYMERGVAEPRSLAVKRLYDDLSNGGGGGLSY